MEFYLSSNWLSHRHPAGEALVDEALAMGFDGLELGYRLQMRHTAGIKARLASGALKVRSVHSYCPVPLEAPSGHPELFLIGDPDEDARALAKINLRRTINFAAEIGASAIVVHAARVNLLRYAPKLSRKLGVKRVFSALRRSLDELLPECSAAKVRLCLENLPSYDALPNSGEMNALLEAYRGAPLASWYDIGHGQVLANLGYEEPPPEGIVGVHIHDVRPVTRDHLAPGTGMVNWTKFADCAKSWEIKVFEPSSQVAPEDLSAGLRLIKDLWR